MFGGKMYVLDTDDRYPTNPDSRRMLSTILTSLVMAVTVNLYTSVLFLSGFLASDAQYLEYTTRSCFPITAITRFMYGIECTCATQLLTY
jgi:hypothetical protein